jgi:DNA-directed RNA polymerase subunit F
MSVHDVVKNMLREVHSRPPVTELTNDERSRRFQRAEAQKAQDKLFDELFGGTVEEHGEALRKIADIATAETTDLRAARDDAFQTYLRLNTAHNTAWKLAWRKARDTMIAEASK